MTALRPLLIALLPSLACAVDVNPIPSVTVDPYVRSSVRTFDTTVYPASNGIPLNWTGSSSTCTVGTQNQDYRDAGILRVNYYRRLVRLPDVGEDTVASAKCMESSLWQLRNNTLDHYPASGTPCYTANVAEAAGHSNLAMNSGMSSGVAINQYVDDSGTFNTAVGHRRWILCPTLTNVGHGDVTSYNTLWVLENGNHPTIHGARPASPTYVAWPYAGYFPHVRMPSSTRWSYSIDGANLDTASISVQDDAGTALTVAKETYATGYGDNTLVWKVTGANTTSPGTADRPYHVLLRNIGGATGRATVHYTVILIDTAQTRTDETRPTATVAATTPACNEGSTPGTFTVTLSSAAQRDTWINYALGGTASTSDFTISGKIKIASGATTGTLDITGTTDAITETGGETVVIALDPGCGYTISGTPTATVTILDPGSTPNSAPVITQGTSTTLAVTEDVAASLTLNATDSNGDTITWSVLTQGTKGTASASGTGTSKSITYTPSTNLNGSDSFVIQVSDGLGGTDTITVNVTITAVNDAPTFTKGANQTVLEDAGAQTVAGWATAISPGPSDESGQTVTGFTLTNTNNGLFSVQPAVAANGTLTYTPAANAFGSATVTITATDSAGATSPGQTFTITVTGVNDAPSFTKGADQTVNEDAGAQSVASWATSISAGPGGESQTLTFTVTNSNNGLFSAQPAVASNGTLTYTVAANATGSATVTVTLGDNGGTANGGVATSASQTFIITVNPVNDAPSFTKGANQTVNEDAAAQTVAGWATAISSGPANESGQTVSFTVSNSNNALFSAQPAISAGGTLTYTPAANANGSATVSVFIADDGGTANGGVASSATQTFTITVNAVNDAPSFTKGADQSVAEDAGAQSVATWASAISKGPADESGQTVSFTLTNSNNALFSAQPAVSSAGTLTYTPAANANGSATVTISISDNGGTANGGVATSASQTFLITVTAVNDAPVVASAIADQGATVNVAYSFTVPVGTFTDVEGTALTWSSDETLGWLSFNPTTRVFSGTPGVGDAGSTTITVTASDGSLSASDSFVLTVSAVVNAAPVITQGATTTLTVLEDGSGSLTINATDGNGDTITWSVLTQGTSGTASASGTGTSKSVSYVPTANANGSDSFVIQVTDGMGGSDSITVTVTITAVNDAPSFTKGADQSVLEDAGAQSVPGWATAISAGPGESQTLTFTATNSNNALFSAQPAIAANGTLTFTPAANANGSATVTVALGDNGGTANGGVATSANQTFVITVTSVNDAPSFTKGADQTIAQNAGARTVTGWATAISAGAANESGQTLSFTVTNSNNALFSAQPALSSTGTLTFTPAGGVTGVATVTVFLSDNGGTANGGDDASNSQTFTITVTNDTTPPTTPSAPSTTSTTSTTPTLSGTTEANATVRIYDNGVLVTTVTANGAGAWSWTPTVPLTTGTHAFTVVAVDGSGNASGTSAATTVIISGGGGGGGGGGVKTGGGGGGGCGAGGGIALLGLAALLALGLRRQRRY